MKWFRNILKGLSLTSALFVFQACYGSPPVDYENLQELETEILEEEVAAAEEEASEEVSEEAEDVVNP